MLSPKTPNNLKLHQNTSATAPIAISLPVRRVRGIPWLGISRFLRARPVALRESLDRSRRFSLRVTAWSPSQSLIHGCKKGACLSDSGWAASLNPQEAKRHLNPGSADLSVKHHSQGDTQFLAHCVSIRRWSGWMWRVHTASARYSMTHSTGRRSKTYQQAPRIPRIPTWSERWTKGS